MRFVSNPRFRFVLVVLALLVPAAAAPAQEPPAEEPPAAQEPPAEEPPAAKPDDKPAADCPPASVAVDVTIGPRKGPLTVEPDSVTISLEAGPGKNVLVCWRVSGLTGNQTLHIEGKEGEPDLFPNLERTVKLPRTTAVSGRASAKGTWRYSLWITVEGSTERLRFTDPEVIVDGGGG